MKTTAFIIIFLITVSCWGQSTGPYNKIGDVAPSFNLADTTQVMHHLSSFKGRILLIDFWASWCGPCIKSLPAMKQLYQKYDDHSEFEIVSISVDFSRKNWIDALNRYQPPWINLNTSKESYATIRSNYDVLTVPKLYLLNSKGIIVGKDLSLQQVDHQIQMLLDKRN